MNNKKKLTEVIKQKVISTALIISANFTGTVAAHSDAFQEATQATENLQKKFVDLARVLFPFSLVILVIAILFTHDQKALQAELKTGLMICIAYIALLIVTNGSFTNTFTNILGGG